MSYKILIVDDDSIIRATLRITLKEYDIIEASNGLDALEILKKPNLISLVILDFRMPGLLGIEALKKIKELNPSLPVIIYTGHSSKDLAIESLKAHADYYIEKPSTLSEIRQAVKKLILENNKLELIDNDVIEKIKYFIEKNYSKKVCLNDAAQEVCLCPKYLSRVFKEKVGIGFNEYKVNLRLNRSKELLHKTKMTVEQIAYEIGYENSESYIRAFQRSEKLTPTEYRLNLK